MVQSVPREKYSVESSLGVALCNTARTMHIVDKIDSLSAEAFQLKVNLLEILFIFVHRLQCHSTKIILFFLDEMSPPSDAFIAVFVAPLGDSSFHLTISLIRRLNVRHAPPPGGGGPSLFNTCCYKAMWGLQFWYCLVMAWLGPVHKWRHLLPTNRSDPHPPPLFSDFSITLCSVRHLLAYPHPYDDIYEQPLTRVAAQNVNKE